uniref:GRIP domain-containing protein n=2 Tax=Schistocephalus solidus TaxID=70667 RepID=A0A0V0J6J2_SCHSO
MSVSSADECFSNVDSLEELRRICSERDARIAKLKVIIIRERKAAAALKEEFKLLTHENTELKASNRVLEDQVVRLSSNTDSIQEINDLKDEISSLQEALKTLKNKHKSLAADADQLRALLSTSEASHAELNRQLTDLQSTISILKADLVTHEAYKSSLHKLANDILANSSFLEGKVALGNQHDFVASTINALAECCKSRGQLVPVAIQTSDQIMELRENSCITENNFAMIDQESLRKTCEAILELERQLSCTEEPKKPEVPADLGDFSPKSINDLTTRLQKCISLVQDAKRLPGSHLSAPEKCRTCPMYISTLENIRLQLSELRNDLTGLRSQTNSQAIEATRELDQLVSQWQPIVVFRNQQIEQNNSDESATRCCIVSSTVSAADILKNDMGELKLQLSQLKTDIVQVLADCSSDFTESLTTMGFAVSSMYKAARVSRAREVRRDVAALVQSAICSKLRHLWCGFQSLSELVLDFKQSINIETSSLSALVQEFNLRKPDKLHRLPAQRVENQIISVQEGSLDYLCRLKLQEVLCSEPIVNNIVPGLENETRKRIQNLIEQIGKIQVLYNKLLLEVRAGESARRESSAEPPSPRLHNYSLLETMKGTLACIKAELNQMKSFVLTETLKLSEGLLVVQELQNNSLSSAVNNLFERSGASSEPATYPLPVQTPDYSSLKFLRRGLASLNTELVCLRHDLEDVKSNFIDYTETFQTCVSTVSSKLSTLLSTKSVPVEVYGKDDTSLTGPDSRFVISSNGPPPKMLEVSVGTIHAKEEATTQMEDVADSAEELRTRVVKLQLQVQDSFTVSPSEISNCDVACLTYADSCITVSSNLTEISVNTDYPDVQSSGFQTESCGTRDMLQERSDVSTGTEFNGQSIDQLEAQLGELHRQVQDSREAYQQQLADLTQHFELQAVDYDRLVRDKEHEISQLKETCDRLSDETEQISALRLRTESSELQIAGLKQILENSIAFIESQVPLQTKAEEEKDQIALAAEKQFDMILGTDQQDSHIWALIERLNAAKSRAAGVQADLREELVNLRAALTRHKAERIDFERHQSVRQSTVDLELANHQTAIDELSKELALKTGSLEEATARLEESEGRIANLNDTNTKLQDRLTKMKQLLLKTRRESGELERRVAGLQTQLEEQESRAQTRERETVSLRADLETAQNLRASAEFMAASARREASAAEQKMRACVQTLGAERDSLAHKLTQLQREFEGYKVKVLHTLRNNSTELNANASWRDESSFLASTEIAHLKEMVVDLERRLAEVSAQLAATSKEYELTKFALSEEKERCETLSQQLAASSAKFKEAQKEAVSDVQQRAAVEIAGLKTSLAEHQKYAEKLSAHMEALKSSLGARVRELETQLANSLTSTEQQQQRATESPTEKAQNAALCANCAKAVEGGQFKDAGTITREIQSSSPRLQEMRPLTIPLEEVLLGESSPQSPSFSSSGLWNTKQSEEEMANLRSTVNRLAAELSNSRRQLSITNDLLRDSEAAVERLNEQAKVLKEEIRRHERNSERDSQLGSGFLSPISSPQSSRSGTNESRPDQSTIPHSSDFGNFSSSVTRNEYLKNIFVKFFELPNNATAEREALVPVLATLLALSPHEREVLHHVAQTGSFFSGTTTPQTWSSYLPSWAGLS